MSEETKNDPDAFTKKAKQLVADTVNRLSIDTGGVADLTLDDFYIVWFAKVLGNWKALVSTDVFDGHYYEVTYNGAKQETYIDTYVKSDNQAVTDMDYHRMVTPMSERNYEFRSIPGVADSLKVNRDGEVQINGRDRYDMSISGIRKHDGTYISVRTAVHLAFPDIPMRNPPME